MKKNYTEILSKYDDKRKKHVLNVMQIAEKLAYENDIDACKAVTAALFHDIVRDKSNKELNEYINIFGLNEKYLNNRNLSHSKIAAELMRSEYGISDKVLTDAVAYHTTGRKDMTKLDKILFLADAIEPERNYAGVKKIREESDISLNKGCIAALKNTIKYLKNKNAEIDNDTIEALESLERSSDGVER